jgi:hypothetical protein
MCRYRHRIVKRTAIAESKRGYGEWRAEFAIRQPLNASRCPAASRSSGTDTSTDTLALRSPLLGALPDRNVDE